jgi:Ca-activated chloride channel homolog
MDALREEGSISPKTLSKTRKRGSILAPIMRGLGIAALSIMLIAPILAQQIPTQTLKVDVDLALINATITDSEGRYVVGLEKGNFQIWEDKVEQQIEYFSTEDVPLSVGLIFDASGSMQETLGFAREAALTFLNTADANDEYFLVEFNDRPHVTVDLTRDISKLQEHIIFIPAKGSTALYDAVYVGMEKIRKANNAKRALLIISDGEENHSRYSFSSVREFVKEQNVQIFSIGAGGPITILSDLTGAYAFQGGQAGTLADICQKIAIELKNEYVIGYRSTNQSKDGRWRKVQVKVNPPRGLPKLHVRSKAGYYAPGPEKPVKP